LALWLTMLGYFRPKTHPTELRPTEAPGDPEAYALVFAEAERMVVAQEANLDELRGRSGIVLTVSAAVMAFVANGILGSQKPVDVFVWVAVAAFAACFCASVAVLLPGGRWGFEMNAKTLLTGYVEGDNPATMAEIHRSLAWYLADAAEVNRNNLVRLYRVFAFAGVLLVVEVGALVVALWRSQP